MNQDHLSQPELLIGADGKPIYDRNFFIRLALLGPERWNTWRQEHSAIRVTFEGLDFGNNNLSFREFSFGDYANFRFCRFVDNLRLSLDKNKRGPVNFSDATFGSGADFFGTYFGYGANFSGVTIGDRADVSNCLFGSSANFSGAHFCGILDMSGTIFGDAANFFGATFDGHADFTGTSFGE